MYWGKEIELLGCCLFESPWVNNSISLEKSADLPSEGSFELERSCLGSKTQLKSPPSIKSYESRSGRNEQKFMKK